MNENELIVDRAFRRPFAYAMAWVTAGGALVIAAMIFVVVQMHPRFLSSAVVIATASIVIALVSMLPGLLSRRPSDGIVVSLMAGIPIRLSGTVALFLTCRYHMASPTESIAAMTIGWYLLLTFIEVVVLARQSPGAVRSTIAQTTDNPLPAKA